MRQSIDELCAIIEDQLKMIRHPALLYFSAEEDGIGSKRCAMNRMALY